MLVYVWFMLVYVVGLGFIWLVLGGFGWSKRGFGLV